jgi:hypothetical protein
VLSGCSRVVLLAFVREMVIVLLALVVVAVLGVVVTLLVLLVCPSLHHIVEFYNGLGVIASKFMVQVPLIEVVQVLLIGAAPRSSR